MYRIDAIENQLLQTQLGREIVKVFERHVDEIVLLVNHNRQVTVTWQRNHGPKFAANILRTAFEEGTEIPKEIEGVTLMRMLRRMAAALQDVGTPMLKKDIGAYFALVLSWASKYRSLPDVLNELERMELQLE